MQKHQETYTAFATRATNEVEGKDFNTAITIHAAISEELEAALIAEGATPELAERLTNLALCGVSWERVEEALI